MELIENKKEAWYLILGLLLLMIIIIGEVLIYQIMFPTPIIPYDPINIVGVGFLLICLSFVIHGFHPILLMKK